MADWQTVRFDPTYIEPLDAEIIPLCDALNAAGFVTTASCWGHGFAWPRVWFEHSTDERIEDLARFVLEPEQVGYAPHTSRFRKEILSDGYSWMLEIHPNDVYVDTPDEESKEKARVALQAVTELVQAWASKQPALDCALA